MASAVLITAEGPPSWAYGVAPGTPMPAPNAPPANLPPSADPKPLHVQGSSLTFTAGQVRNPFGPADWFPDDHPPMPPVVAKGRTPDVRACGLCHLPNGKGRAENAPLAGLPHSYLVQALVDFKDGVRHSADRRKSNTNVMIAIAEAMTDGEMHEAARYFSSIKMTPWIKVVESATVPKTTISFFGLFLRAESGGTEPIGRRIIEIPEDTERTELLRDPRSGFVAYVPVGSIKQGQTLVTTGGGKTTQCAICHGADLKGSGPVPGIAGRSPSYVVRQMYDIQAGTRKGLWSDLMKPVVAKLSEDDMLAIAAYTASREP
jgi:cytochrome c553